MKTLGFFFWLLPEFTDLGPWLLLASLSQRWHFLFYVCSLSSTPASVLPPGAVKCQGNMFDLCFLNLYFLTLISQRLNLRAQIPLAEFYTRMVPAQGHLFACYCCWVLGTVLIGAGRAEWGFDWADCRTECLSFNWLLCLLQRCKLTVLASIS